MNKYLIKSINGSLNMILGVYDTKDMASEAFIQMRKKALELIENPRIYELNKEIYDIKKKLFYTYLPHQLIENEPTREYPFGRLNNRGIIVSDVSYEHRDYPLEFFSQYMNPQDQYERNHKLHNELMASIGETYYDYYEKNGVFTNLIDYDNWVYRNIVRKVFPFGLKDTLFKNKSGIVSKLDNVEIIEFEMMPTFDNNIKVFGE